MVKYLHASYSERRHRLELMGLYKPQYRGPNLLNCPTPIEGEVRIKHFFKIEIETGEGDAARPIVDSWLQEIVSLAVDRALTGKGDYRTTVNVQVKRE